MSTIDLKLNIYGLNIEFRGEKEIFQEFVVESAKKYYEILFDALFFSVETESVSQTADISLDEISEKIPEIWPEDKIGDTLMKLFNSNWGLKPRTLIEIMEALEINTIYYNKSSVNNSLASLHSQKLIRRFKEDNMYRYVLIRRKS